MPNMSQGTFARLDVDGELTCFVEVKDKTNISYINNHMNSICGSIDHNSTGVETGIVVPRLHFLMQPTPEELDYLLEWIGFTETTDTFALNNAIGSKSVKLDRVASSGAADDLGNGYVDKAIFRAQKGPTPLSLEIEAVFDAIPDIGGHTWNANSATKTAPMGFHRSTLTLEGATRTPESFVYVIDNHLAVQHNNSIVPTGFEIGGPGRTHHVGFDIPYISGNVAVLTNPITDVTAGAAANIVFTRGGQSTTFSWANLKTQPNPPDVAKKEIRLKSFYEAFQSGATKPVVITHDPVA